MMRFTRHILRQSQQCLVDVTQVCAKRVERLRRAQQSELSALSEVPFETELNFGTFLQFLKEQVYRGVPTTVAEPANQDECHHRVRDTTHRTRPADCNVSDADIYARMEALTRMQDSWRTTHNLRRDILTKLVQISEEEEALKTRIALDSTRVGRHEPRTRAE